MIEDWIICISLLYIVYHYVFQAAEEEVIEEMKPIGSAEMKIGSEVLRNMNNGQENYDGITISFWQSNAR